MYDVDGSRTSLVAPALNRMAEHHALPVLVCMAHTIGGCAALCRNRGNRCLWPLIEGIGVLLATDPVLKLIIYLGNHEPTDVLLILDRMLVSSESDLETAGGQLAAYAVLEWGIGDRLEGVLAGLIPRASKCAQVCANRLPGMSIAAVANATLMTLVDDSDEDVRKATAEMAVPYEHAPSVLRGCGRRY